MVVERMISGDTRRMRGDKPFVFTNLKAGQGLNEIIKFIEVEGMLVKS